MSFKEIIGNNNVKEFIEEQVKNDHVLHSYLFVGIDGIGKKLFAREFARKILCINKENQENCSSCIKFRDNNHPDFKQIEPENGVIKIETIRNLQQEIAQKPIASSKKVYLIINSDAMTREAQNCLLKTLEEPPEYATIILTTANEAKLLNTIKSRCIKISFAPINKKEIKIKLKEILQEQPNEELIDKSQGSLGRAVKLQENKEIYRQVDNILVNMNSQSIVTLFNDSEVLYKEKEKIQEILEYIEIYLFETKDMKMIDKIQYVEETKKRILLNSNYDMCIDYLLMKLNES